MINTQQPTMVKVRRYLCQADLLAQFEELRKSWLRAAKASKSKAAKDFTRSLLADVEKLLEADTEN